MLFYVLLIIMIITNDDHVQVLHALLRAVHQEGERTVEKKIP